MRRIMCFVQVSALAALTMLAGCHNDSAPDLSMQPATGGNIAQSEPLDAPAGLPALPSPASLARSASAPPTDNDRLCLGHEWDAQLPSNRVSAEVFTPEYAGAAGRELSDAAYAMFRFSNMDEYAGPAQLELGWTAEGDAAQEVYAGLANFSENVWVWRKLPANDTVVLSSFDPYVDASGDSLVTVVSLDNGEFFLDFVLLGDTTLPVVSVSTTLNPNPLLNIAPLNVSFDATATRSYGGAIVDFDFDWEGDGAWDDLNDEDGLGIHQYPAGNYACKVLARDDEGQTAIAVLEFAIIDPENEAPVAAFTRTPSSGDGPLTVEFDASTSSDPDGYLTKYEWDIFADGIYEIVSGQPEASAVFAIAGSNAVRLRVTDNFFATNVTTMNVQVQKGWHHHLIHNSAETRYRLATCTTTDENGARACVAYQEFETQKLRFARATNADATAWTGVIFPVTTISNTGFSPSMAVVTLTGAPIIAYGEATAGILPYVVRAEDPSGALWENPVLVDGANKVGTNLSLAVINTLPCIAACNAGLNPGQGNVLYYAAQNSTGTAWGPPLEVLPATEGITYKSVALGMTSSGVLRRPVVASGANLNLAPSLLYISAATNIDGTAWNPPAEYGVFSSHMGILSVNGRPTFCGSAPGTNYGAYFVRANESDGTTWPEQPQSIAATAVSSELLVVDGTPLFFYQEPNGNLLASSATNADGTAWDAPYLVALRVSEFSSHMRGTLVDGKVVLCYQAYIGEVYEIKSMSWY